MYVAICKLNTVHTVHAVNTVNTVHTVHMVTVNTVHTVHTALVRTSVPPYNQKKGYTVHTMVTYRRTERKRNPFHPPPCLFPSLTCSCILIRSEGTITKHCTRPATAPAIITLPIPADRRPSNAPPPAVRSYGGVLLPLLPLLLPLLGSRVDAVR